MCYPETKNAPKRYTNCFKNEKLKAMESIFNLFFRYYSNHLELDGSDQPKA